MQNAIELANRQHGVITAAQLQDLGVSRGVVRRFVGDGVLRRTSRGVYVLGGFPATWRQRLMRSVLAGGEGAAASHRSAAALLGLAGFREGPIDVTRGGHRSRLSGGRTYHESNRLPEDHVQEIDGIRVTTAARTAFDLCHVMPARAARVVDDVITTKLASPAELDRVLARLAGRGRAGIQLFREILDARDDDFVPTESDLEDLCVAVLAAAGLEAPERQVVLGDGELIGRVDLLYRRARLVIEVDSRTWHDGWKATIEDRRRDAKLMAAGWQVLRVTYWQLTHEPEPFIAAVRTVLARSAA